MTDSPIADPLRPLAVPIGLLDPMPDNPRRGDIDAVARSYATFGQRKPIVARRGADGRGTVIAGNHQLAAATRLGWSEIAVVWVDDDDATARAYALADNRTAELGGYDDEQLASLIRDVAVDPALLAATGWTDADLEALATPADRPARYADTPRLTDRFVVPPFSVLDARAGYWQQRKREWLALGIKSEEGRSDELTYRSDPEHEVGAAMAAIGLTSVFDPVVCELAYRWFTPPAGRILDPFAGGSVRGIVAAACGHPYVGIDLRAEQVAANVRQLEEITARLGPEADTWPAPTWLEGDSRRLDKLLPADDGAYDLVFSCPPYADLERYSDDPADISTLEYDRFLEAYEEIIRLSLARLADDRYAVWVIGDVRDKRTGYYRGLGADTIRIFESAGASLYNECALLMALGTLPLRAPRYMTTTRKVGRAHQYVYVFVKGDPRRAHSACGPIEIAPIPGGEELSD